MSHGERAERRTEKDWWGKRPLVNYTVSYNGGVNKFFKRLLHKKERQINQKEIKTQLEEITCP